MAFDDGGVMGRRYWFGCGAMTAALLSQASPNKQTTCNCALVAAFIHSAVHYSDQAVIQACKADLFYSGEGWDKNWDRMA